MLDWIELSAYLVTSSRVVSEDRFELWGFALVVDTDYVGITLYNKTTADAEASLGRYTAWRGPISDVMFPRGITLERGLYVAVESGVINALIIGRPVFDPPA